MFSLTIDSLSLFSVVFLYIDFFSWHIHFFCCFLSFFFLYHVLICNHNEFIYHLCGILSRYFITSLNTTPSFFLSFVCSESLLNTKKEANNLWYSSTLHTRYPTTSRTSWSTSQRRSISWQAWQRRTATMRTLQVVGWMLSLHTHLAEVPTMFRPMLPMVMMTLMLWW